MKNNKLALAILLLLTLCMTSCSSDDEPEIEIPKSYELASITWKLDEALDDKIEETETKLPSITYTNRLTSVVSYTIYPLENVEQTSLFQCEEKDIEFMNKWVKEGLKVPIPIEPSILSSHYGYLAGGQSVPFDFKDAHKIPMTTTISETFDLHPNSKYKHQSTVYFKEVTATFLASFREENTGERYEIIGKWKGEIFDTVSSEGTYEDL